VIVNRTPANAIALKDSLSADSRYQGISISVQSQSNSRIALVGADIIVTVTGSAVPVFDGQDVEEGTHINCVGSHSPPARELDTTIVKKSKIVVDEKKACLAEAGDILIPIKEGAISADHILAEVGNLVQGTQVRTSPSDITIFKSVGVAVQDVTVGLAVYSNALKMGLGTLVDTSKAKL